MPSPTCSSSSACPPPPVTPSPKAPPLPDGLRSPTRSVMKLRPLPPFLHRRESPPCLTPQLSLLSTAPPPSPPAPVSSSVVDLFSSDIDNRRCLHICFSSQIWLPAPQNRPPSRSPNASHIQDLAGSPLPSGASDSDSDYDAEIHARSPTPGSTAEPSAAADA
ncbi:hypothetical protein OROHE_021907 [Orobanche hederae]